MELEIRIKNKDKIISAFEKAPRLIGKRIDRAIKRSGVFVAGKTKEHITSGTDMWKPPIDTGAMRRGIAPSFAPLKATIRPSPITDYAIFVHEGTRFMQERPFFTITAKREQVSVEKFFNKELAEAIKEIVR